MGWKRLIQAMIVTCGLAVVAIAPPTQGAVAGQDPTDVEQLFIYLLNRARSDPAAWQARYSSVLSPEIGLVAPAPPLALNTNLVRSARFHSDEMATFDYFGHTSAVTGDQPNKMARDAGYDLPIGSYPDNANYIESLAAGPSSALNALNLLLEDAGVPSLGHRKHLLGMAPFTQFFEVGVGYAFNASATYRHYWSIHTGERSVSLIHLTGVVFDDLNGNNEYDLGEGIGGVTVSDGSSTTTTNSQGGWSLAVSGGLNTVTASGGSFSGTSTGQVTMGGVNHSIDFISGMPGGIVDFVIPNNAPPTAVDDTDTTDQAVAVTIDVLANDTDPDLDTLTIISVTDGSSGTVTNNGGADVTYSPTGSFTGVDSFTYTIDDGNGATSVATVTVTVVVPDLTAPTATITDIEITGQTNDPFAVVTVGGAGASTFGSTAFTRNITLTGAVQVIPVVATDAAGNPANRSVTVTP